MIMLDHPAQAVVH